MKKLNVLSLPLAVNVCDQMLREIDRNETWSNAHVIMNPFNASLLHRHKKMSEVYIITQGVGHLTVGGTTFAVQPGNAILIPPRFPHKLVNMGATTLQHLVLASPPFDPADVEILEKYPGYHTLVIATLPDVVECFDGAKIMAYEFPNIASVAIGRVIADPKWHKEPHYHKVTREWVYVLEGTGIIEIDEINWPLAPHDWVEVEPGKLHALRNSNTHDLVVMCICTPQFDMSDVFFRTKN